MGKWANVKPSEAPVFTHLLHAKTGLTQASSLEPVKCKTRPMLHKDIPTK